jgi:hypothetical protein
MPAAMAMFPVESGRAGKTHHVRRCRHPHRAPATMFPDALSRSIFRLCVGGVLLIVAWLHGNG